jgi:uncharacterized membrane protein
MSKHNFHVSESRLVRFLIARRRLMSSILAGVIVFLALPGDTREVTRILLAWDTTAGIYVAFALFMISRSSVETCHWRAALYDEGDWMIVLIVVACCGSSLVAIFSELAAIKSGRVNVMPGLIVAGLTVALSWTFTHVSFTLHYANLYYRSASEHHHGGLKFPGERPPDYRDFLYYSFVIGCAAQTADVETISPVMRLVSLIQGVVAFAFNTAILALTINVGASLLA